MKNSSLSRFVFGSALVAVLAAVGLQGSEAQAFPVREFGRPAVVAAPVYARPAVVAPVYNRPVFARPAVAVPVYANPAPVYANPAPVYANPAPVAFAPRMEDGHFRREEARREEARREEIRREEMRTHGARFERQGWRR